MSKCKYLLVSFLFLLVLSACQPSRGQTSAQTAANGDRTIIDDPTDGATLPLGPVRINVHAEDPTGLATIQISVNGNPLQTSSLQDVATRASAYVSTVWTPSAPGKYEIEATAVDQSGEKNPIAHVSVTIAEAGATFSTQPTNSEPPAFVSTIPAAAPTLGGSSSSSGPTPTPTPIRLAGAVSTPGLTTPLLASPIKTNTVPCASVTLAWQPPSDVNAAKYDVELQKIVGKDAITVKTWNDLADTHASFTPECNMLYRWHVRGKSDSGDSLDWSDYEDFRTGLPAAK